MDLYAEAAKTRFDTEAKSNSGMTYSPRIADLHVVVIWLQLPEFLSFFLYYLNFEFPVGFEKQLPWLT